MADLVSAIEADSDIKLSELMVDGGACENDFLMQFQSDILATPVNRPLNPESTALGACFLAGLGCGVFRDAQELKKIRQTERMFTPDRTDSTRDELMSGWKAAVAMCRSGAAR